ncbi:MAG: pyridoxal phosphate-dependent aminotransferase [Bacteroidota bacterium]|nr:pyridoxal phosphate-dependent aminotransferase [Bacteroidota bacterium]
MISDRARQIGISATLRINAKAKAMKAEGIDVIDLSVGEPDFPTPVNIKDAAKKALDTNQTKYTATEGTPELKKAIINRLKEDHDLDYSASQIIVSCGAKHSLYNLMVAILNDGEEVIIPAPYWVSYPEMVMLSRGKPVIINAKEENGFRITAKQLKDAVSSSTKAIILNNPSNPTGTAYSKAELEEIASVIVDENIIVVADEIYGKLVYDEFKFHSFASLGAEVKKRTVIVNGVSKAYSMTGWRIGFAAGPVEIIDAMSKIQSHSTSNAASISQLASVEAYNGPQHEVSKMQSEFQKRRNYVINKLQTIPNISCIKPEGAFYVFPNVSSYYDKEFEGTIIRNSYGMAYYLLKHANVAIVPGDAFGADNFIRISYATSMENLEKGLNRIVEAFGKLKTQKKVKRVSLNNSVTKFKKLIPVESQINIERRDALVAEAEAYLHYDNYYEWNANINGVVVQLRTNVGHLADFWMENWYPAQLEADIEPHGLIYAVDGVSGREPHAFYNSETKTGILFNTDYYASLRSLALGLVTDVAERLFDVHAIRGMSADVDGQGLLFIGPPGTKKSETLFGLLKAPNALFHSNDYLFIRYGGGYAAADNPERKVFISTYSAELFDPLPKLFDRLKCENVVTRKDDCTNLQCQRDEECRLDRGSPYCYKASMNSYAMLDPYWIGGMKKHVKRTDIRFVFVLRNDPLSQPIVRLGAEEAIRILEMGQTSGVSREVTSPLAQPFYNPHLLVNNSERIELQKRFFKKLLKTAACYQLNVGNVRESEIQKKIREVIGGS